MRGEPVGSGRAQPPVGGPVLGHAQGPVGGVLGDGGSADVATRGRGVQINDALGLAQREDPIIGRRTAARTGDGLVRVLVMHCLDEATLNGGKRCLVKVPVHPRAQIGMFPCDVLEGHVVILAGLEDIRAQQQQLAIDLIENDPPNRLGPIGRVAILLVGAKLDRVAFGRAAVRQRRIDINEGLRALRGIAVASQRMEDLVGALGVPGLVKGDGLTVAHRVARDDRQSDSEREHKENRANAHGFSTK